MKKYLENVLPVTITLLLVLVFGLMVGQKVYGQNIEIAERQAREAKESVYMNAVRTVLEEKGFHNSGVNMTKAMNECGEWEYTVTVYNRSFDWMENTDKAKLESYMEDMGSDVLGKISLTLFAR